MVETNAPTRTGTLKHCTAALAALVAVLASVAVAVAYLATNQWFGVGDLPGMLIWSLPLGALIYLCFRPLVARLGESRALWRYAALVMVGGVLGIVWTVATMLILGGWIMAFSFPVPFCWVAAGLLAGIAAAWLPVRRSWPIASVLVVIVLLGLARLNAYAQAPEPRVRVVMAEGTSDADINTFWQEVIGRPGQRPGEFEVLEGISGAGVTGYEGERPVFTVSFRKRLDTERRNALIAHIQKSPLVERVEIMPQSDRSGIRVSVSY